MEKGTKVGGERESRYRRRAWWWMTGVSTGAWRRAGVLSGSCITHHDRKEGRIAWWLSAGMGMGTISVCDLKCSILGPAQPEPDASLSHSHTSPSETASLVRARAQAKLPPQTT
jgi:hypothetical protein